MQDYKTAVDSKLFFVADLMPRKGDTGIETPDHAHHFAVKGIEPKELTSSLTKAIAISAQEGERRLNDFSASPVERLNPLYAMRMAEVEAEKKEEGEISFLSLSISGLQD